MMDALSFLRDITGYAQAQAQAQPGSATRPIRLATIDDGYNPADFVSGTLPQVTFDGEATLSGKFYPVMAPYWPQPGDRVALAPVGTTYLIIGAVETGRSVGVVVGWTTPSLTTGYTHNGNDNGTLQYRVVDLLGTRFVQWRGAVNRGTGATVTTVPTIARPSARRSISVARNSNVLNEVKADFNTDGTVTLVGETTDGAPAPTWIAFSNVQYSL